MSRTELGTALQIRHYVDADEAAVLALLVSSLGQGPSGRRTSEFFRWKHLENPFGASLMMVAELDGQVVGLRAFLRWHLTYGDRTIRAVRAVDTATHRDHRGRGVFSKLTRHALEELSTDTDLIFNTPNASSLPGYLKLGWREVGKMPVLIKVRRPVAFTRGLRSAMSLSAHPTREIEVSAARAAEVLGDPDLEAFLDQLGDPIDRLTTPYSREYLDWRYARAPLGYHSIVTRDTDGLTGLAIFRVRPRGVLWETTVAEILVRPRDTHAAAELIDRVSASAPVDHLTCHFPSGSPQLAAARKRRFLRSPKGELLTVRPLIEGLDLAMDPASWGVSLGTLEVF